MDRLLRHIVLFSYKDTVSHHDRLELARRFSLLPSLIDAIHDFECGSDNSPELLARGYKDAFIVTFLSEADRDAYLPHPAHQEFVSFLGRFVKDALVLDYWTGEIGM